MKSKIVIIACIVLVSFGMLNTAEASAPSVSFSQCDKRVRDAAISLQWSEAGNTQTGRFKNCTRINKTAWSGSAAVVYWIFPGKQCTACWEKGEESPTKEYPICAWKYLVLNKVAGEVRSYWSPVIRTRRVDRPECQHWGF